MPSENITNAYVYILYYVEESPAEKKTTLPVEYYLRSSSLCCNNLYDVNPTANVFLKVGKKPLRYIELNGGPKLCLALQHLHGRLWRLIGGCGVPVKEPMVRGDREKGKYGESKQKRGASGGH